jgi:hypothetical protein
VKVDRHSLDGDHGIFLCLRAKVAICGDREMIHTMQSLHLASLSPGGRAFATEICLHWRVGRQHQMLAAQRDLT